MAAEMIPPAYPAPSPAGKSPAVCGCISVAGSRGMRTGEEVRDSTPTTSASFVTNPRSFLSNEARPPRSASEIVPGIHCSIRVAAMPGT